MCYYISYWSIYFINSSWCHPHPFHSIPFDSIPYCSLYSFLSISCQLFHSNPFHFICSYLIPSCPISFHSVLFYNIRYNSILIHPIPFNSTPYRSLYPSIHSLLSIHSCVQVSMLLILILPSMLSFFIIRSHSFTIPSIQQASLHASNSHASIHPFCFILSDFILLHSIVFHSNPFYLLAYVPIHCPLHSILKLTVLNLALTIVVLRKLIAECSLPVSDLCFGGWVGR